MVVVLVCSSFAKQCSSDGSDPASADGVARTQFACTAGAACPKPAPAPSLLHTLFRLFRLRSAPATLPAAPFLCAILPLRSFSPAPLGSQFVCLLTACASTAPAPPAAGSKPPPPPPPARAASWEQSAAEEYAEDEGQYYTEGGVDDGYSYDEQYYGDDASASYPPPPPDRGGEYYE